MCGTNPEGHWGLELNRGQHHMRLDILGEPDLGKVLGCRDYEVSSPRQLPLLEPAEQVRAARSSNGDHPCIRCLTISQCKHMRCMPGWQATCAR